ncbi:N-acetylglucosaminyl-phosphatidylinositol de-N-acetylase isoform X2 [Hoplias malabaricus]|uniref:N-acetylglucosaminyl-phosphatidylinositol de-N-acetylase isoform X2 n=1 Tax=Hoplias malabaricus TaxID=27720 RepID=UPI0034635C0E
MFVLVCAAAFCFLGYFISVNVLYRRLKQTPLFRSLRTNRALNSLWGSVGENGVKALVVTAHPDDECMFFAPSILKLSESNASLRLLCMSSGNYYNQGAQRREELLDSCEVLGISADQVTIIDNKDLPDDPKAEWSTALTSSLILKHIRTHSINLVLTFDEGGVSGHANHIAIYKALSHLASVGRIPEGCQILTLHTISLLRKYLSILELPISWLLPSSFCCVSGMEEYTRAKSVLDNE